MNPLLLRFVAVLALATHALHAGDDTRLTRLKAADDERVAAIMAGDRARLTAIFSDELRYAHSSGAVDTKDSYIDALASGRTKYLAIDYRERNFTFPAPGVALMTGQAAVKIAKADAKIDMVLGFLGVWREEGGQWKFLSWQSCKLPDAAPAAK